MKNIFSVKNTIIFWSVVVILVYLFSKNLSLTGGIFLAAIISILIMIYTINSEWRGTIIKIANEKVYNNNGEYQNYRIITYAYIKLDNGKRKKVTALKGWKEGDKIIKVKGEFAPKIARA